MDVEAQVMSRNSMASGLPVKKFLISGPSSPMKKQDLGNILITNPVSNHRAYEEFQIRNHMLAAVSESDGFKDEDYSPHPWTQAFIRLKGFRDEDYSLEFTKEWSWNKNTEVQAERAFFNRRQMRTKASQMQMHIVKT
ncbi:hypothetical protein NC651_031779 [Populus alba x Populus x berolinensis]|nr:hypothetical protein NC651_031779 [Populus alba x Populus x berolinensis]